MLRRYGQYFAIGVFIIDIVWLMMAWGLSFELRFYTSVLSSIGSVQAAPDLDPYLRVLVPLGIIFAAVGINTGFYRTGRMWSLDREIRHTVRGCLLIVFVFGTFLYMAGIHRINQVFLGVFFVTLTIGLCVLRISQSILLDILRSKGFYTRKTLLVGDGTPARLVYERLSANDNLGFEFVGVLTESGSAHDTVPNALGSYSDLESTLAEREISQVLITLPAEQSHLLDSILEKMHSLIIDIRVVPDLFKHSILHNTNTVVEGIPMVSLNESYLSSRSLIMKRMLDVSVALAAVLIFSPVMFLVAVIIKCTSSGPVLYRQLRMGLDGQVFSMLKFRTMPVNVEADTGEVWATEHDARPTKLGAFLRKSSLDELPQLFNVILGHMSLVGPRPERPVFVEDFRKKYPGYVLRHKMKAGITGWAQVNGWRGNTSLEKRVEYDLYYIDNWSLFFDIRILLLTLRYGFIHPNAY
ncbi:MAG: undecaprenyl-phosphate glucose phosphotransferase [Planctomycetota bacterium]|jgi:Undecaprenyl-phosphate glucose phosphotransferase|nr:undecaprenyl-phosphate glucose phosphotransferase [Planctomycetota bacterium]